MAETTYQKPKTDRVRDKNLAQTFHDRAKGASEEFHKLLLSIAGVTLGIYFITLTKELSQITRYQMFTCLFGILTMGTAVFVGLLGLFADMKRFYFWGCAKQELDRSKRDAFYLKRDRWLARQNLSRPVLIVCFILGIISSIIFMVFRLTNI